MVMMPVTVCMSVTVRMAMTMPLIGLIVMMLMCDAHDNFIACAGP